MARWRQHRNTGRQNMARGRQHRNTRRQNRNTGKQNRNIQEDRTEIQGDKTERGDNLGRWKKTDVSNMHKNDGSFNKSQVQEKTWGLKVPVFYGVLKTRGCIEDERLQNVYGTEIIITENIL